MILFVSNRVGHITPIFLIRDCLGQLYAKDTTFDDKQEHNYIISIMAFMRNFLFISSLFAGFIFFQSRLIANVC